MTDIAAPPRPLTRSLSPPSSDSKVQPPSVSGIAELKVLVQSLSDDTTLLVAPAEESDIDFLQTRNSDLVELARRQQFAIELLQEKLEEISGESLGDRAFGRSLSLGSSSSVTKSDTESDRSAPHTPDLTASVGPLAINKDIHNDPLPLPIPLVLSASTAVSGIMSASSRSDRSDGSDHSLSAKSSATSDFSVDHELSPASSMDDAKRSDSKKQPVETVTEIDEPSIELGKQPDVDLSVEQIQELMMAPETLEDFRVGVNCFPLTKVSPDMRFTKNEPDIVFKVHNPQTGARWHIAKDISQFRSLDSSLRARDPKRVLYKLPERSFWTSASPVKADVRSEIVNVYFGQVFEYYSTGSTPELAAFLTSNVVEMRSDNMWGYLSTRSRFGGWKSRFYTRQGSNLYALDRPGGAVQQTICLRLAKINAVNERISDSDDENRFGISITEHRDFVSKPSTIVVCADSVANMESWLADLQEARRASRGKSGNGIPQAVLPFVVAPGQENVHGLRPAATNRSILTVSPASPGHRKKASLSVVITSEEYNNNETGPVANVAPTTPPLSPGRRGSARGNGLRILSKGSAHLPAREPKTPTSSQAPTASWGSSAALSARSAGRRTSPPPVPTNVTPVSGQLPSADWARMSCPVSNNNVFGAPLERALQFSSTNDANGAPIPTVIAQCIDFLEQNDAAAEQGIFRLSGTQSHVDELERLFEENAHPNIFAQPGADINVVATLLKRFLRYLPETPLVGTDDQAWRDALAGSLELRAAQLHTLAQSLNSAQFSLLNAVLGYLAKVSRNEAVNKMSLRNLAIVFSPTLQVPGPLISALIEDYETVFAPV